ncbi:uncharacterized protein [Apostichopus japonicus]|uniref:uncharacterized protein isoform X2 n=1 Tax=Stichopus japonicus TaxID=307972 RepID=UPI003AB56DBF
MYTSSTSKVFVNGYFKGIDSSQEDSEIIRRPDYKIQFGVQQNKEVHISRSEVAFGIPSPQTKNELNNSRLVVDHNIPVATMPNYHPKTAQINNSRKLLFIHIPKTGGTSIESSFLFKEQRRKHAIGGHHKISEFNQKHFENYHKFCMVRHPCSRLISAWSYLGQNRGNAKDKRWVKQNLTAETRKSFDSFVRMTLAPEGHVKIQDENHLQTQVGMIFRENGNFGLDQMLVFEKWEESIDVLGLRIKTDVSAVKVRHLTRSLHKTCEDSYTSDTWAKMVKLYEMDFCVLGYSSDINRTDITPQLNFTQEILNDRYQSCVKQSGNGLDARQAASN